ncbi:MAG TPA: alpha/beta hydrolase [Burkholderiaceae bacterium]|nr:alpha/beta hydrolase [Burkholderiaceae bacterium]
MSSNSLPDVERTLVFGSERNLVGTLTMPSGEPGQRAPRTAVLLTNVGIMPRCGPYRVNVDLARRFARIGVPTLRFDMSGLGDSGRSSGAKDVAQQWILDTRAAMDAVQAQLGIRRFIMIGVCSGADIAYLTAPDEPRLSGIVMFDPYLYPTRRSAVIGLVRRVRGLGLTATAKLMAGRVQRAVRRVVAKGEAEGEQPESTMRYGASAPPLSEFAAKLGATVKRGGRVMLLYSGSYPYHHNYEAQTADNLRPYGLADKVEYAMIQAADHVLMGLAGRRQFLARCVETVERWTAAPTPQTADTPTFVPSRLGAVAEWAVTAARTQLPAAANGAMAPARHAA